MDWVVKTESIGVLAQLIAAAIGVIAYISATLPPQHEVLRTALGLELVVQAIQTGVYLWLIASAFAVSRLALKRYWDWFFTTPLMLFTIILVMEHEATNTSTSPEPWGIRHFISTYKREIAGITLANAGMLLFGILGETNVISRLAATVGGFACMVVSFGIVYTQFAVKSTMGKQLFAYIAVLWALYGIVYLWPDYQKNVGYNIIDVFAKNLFLVFLAWKVSTHAQKSHKA